MTILTMNIIALFSTPLDVPTTATSFLWVIPIGLAISMVCKALKMEQIKPWPFVREVMLLFLTGIGLLIFVGLTLLAIAHLAQL